MMIDDFFQFERTVSNFKLQEEFLCITKVKLENLFLFFFKLAHSKSPLYKPC
ncbi:hypothetical protein Scep_013651 [Stephania cephalantha]|uniref:Uncharacterized protein n=1 Tax=Stephania cephalantha TaxID=152367 RepID=A0AAP0P7S9_9MAGN